MENKKIESTVNEEVFGTLLANKVVGNKSVTLDHVQGTISKEGQEDIVYDRYAGEIVSIDKHGKTLVNYIRDDKGKSHEVPVKKKFSLPGAVGVEVAQAILDYVENNTESLE